MESYESITERLANGFTEKEEEKWTRIVNGFEKHFYCPGKKDPSSAKYMERVLFVIFKPSWEKAPFYWREEILDNWQDCYSTASGIVNYFEEVLLTDKTKKYATSLVAHFYQQIIEKINDMSEVVLGYYLFYRVMMFNFLTELDDNDIEKISSNLVLNNLKDNDNGFLVLLMRLPQIDHKWILFFDKQAKDLIIEQSSGKKLIVDGWQPMIETYLTSLIELAQKIIISYPDLKYPLDLYAEQISFAIDHTKLDDPCFIYPALPEVFQFLEGDKYKNIRHKIARYAFFGDSIVCSPQGVEAVEQALKEFEDDSELMEKINMAIKKGEEWEKNGYKF